MTRPYKVTWEEGVQREVVVSAVTPDAAARIAAERALPVRMHAVTVVGLLDGHTSRIDLSDTEQKFSASATEALK